VNARRLIPLLIVAGVIAAYWHCLRYPFIFDDRWHIAESSLIRKVWPPAEILERSARPVVIFSLALNYALGGLNPAGYRLFNAGIHLLAALILYGVVRRTLSSEHPWLAGLVALIWALHPLQTESVTYTIQRAESLMGLFYLLTLYCVIRGAGNRWWHLGAGSWSLRRSWCSSSTGYF
jgi:dolichyl-phosphate-mannose--protein O-mannosyl transferase